MSDDPVRLRAAIDELANALRPALIIADHLQRTTGTIAADAASLSKRLEQAVSALRTLQAPPEPEGRSSYDPGRLLGSLERPVTYGTA